MIFDFNGTLSDDEPILFAIFADLFATHLGWQMTAEEYETQLLGHSDREIVEIAVATHRPGDHSLAEALLTQRRERYKAAVADHSPITRSSAELVDRLARGGVPMAIVTGAQRQDVLAVLENCPTGNLISHLVTEEDVNAGKPNPEGFLRGAGLLGADPADILVFEDSAPGVRGAQRAGMACVAILGQDPSPEVAAAADACVIRLEPGLLDGTGI